MTEKHITFATAKLAKEKKFDTLCMWSYLKGLPVLFGSNNQFESYISSPTQSLLQKWIREVHNIHVNPEPYGETADHTGDITGYYMGDIIHSTGGQVLVYGDDNYSTYEEALEAGLFKALKEIK
jgi:hypothetical protein